MTIEFEKVRTGMADHLPIAVLSLGTGLGFLADQLFGFIGPSGLGFFLWTLLFSLSLAGLTSFFTEVDPRLLIAWPLTAVTAAGLILLRSTPIVVLGLLLVMLVAMAMFLLLLGRRSLQESTLTEHLRALVLVPWQSVTGAIPLLSAIDLGAGFNSPRSWSLLRGALLALPLLLVFSGLFSSADAGFSKLFSGLMDIFSERTVQHLVLTVLFGWLSTGLLASITGNRVLATPSRWRVLQLGTEDTAVLMGLLAVLFLVFVFLQLGYLFGGRETIEAASGLTLAQYARRGFFELLAVAGLTLWLLILVSGSGCNQRVFRPLASVLLGCVLVIQVSALQRLLLYTDAFGLTIDRLAALAVMAWLAVGLLLFATTLLRGQTRAFAAGMTVSGVIAVFVLAVSNPAAVVARTNTERANNRLLDLDISYLLDLGPDAVPALIGDFDKRMPSPRLCVAAIQMFSRWYSTGAVFSTEQDDWRGWNYSRRRAQVLIGEFESRLKELASPCVSGDSLTSEFEAIYRSGNLPLTFDGTLPPPATARFIRWLNAG